MTNPKPPKASPLTLLSHRFAAIALHASEQDQPGGGFTLNTGRRLQQDSDDPRLFRLILDVRVGSVDPGRDAPYSAELTIKGEFEVAETYPAERVAELVRVTGASILYGACREMLANLTARSIHGMISLPSVSFIEGKSKAAQKEAARKTARKTARGPARKTAKGAAKKR